MLLDPNTLSKDGTVAFKGAGYSDDGGLMAYGLSEAGSDWEDWRVRDVASGKDLPDEIRWAKFTGASWRKDGSGFYYCGLFGGAGSGQSLKAPNQYHKLFFHKLGTPQSQDREDLCPHRRSRLVRRRAGHGRRTLPGHHGQPRNRRQEYAAGRGPDAAEAALKPIIAEPRASYTFVGNIGSTLYVLTDDDAPRYRLIAIDLAKPDRAHWRTVVAESQDTLDSVTLVGEQLIAQYLHDAHSVVRRYTPEGKPRRSAAAGIGHDVGFAGRLEDAVTYYSYTDYTTPASIYRLDLKTGRSALWRAPHLAADSSPPTTRRSRCSTRARTAPGCRCSSPRARERRSTADNPTILYGYGGFNDSIAAGVFGRRRRMARAGRGVRGCESARRRRVRARLARGGDEDAQAECIR